MLSRLWRRMRALGRADSLYREMDEEFAFHLQMRAEELSRSLPEETARREARRRFGDLSRLSEQGHDVRGAGVLADAAGDARLAWRAICKSPAKSAVLIATLALGIGINTAVFGVVKSILLDPLPFPGSARLITLHQVKRGEVEGVSYPNFLDLRAASRSLSDIAVYAPVTATLQEGGRARRVSGVVASANLFRVLGVQPVLGRLFLPEEDLRGARSMLISDSFWRDGLQQRADVLDLSLQLDGKLFRIAGVIPSRLAFPVSAEHVDYWTTVSLDAEPSPYGGSVAASRGYPRYDAAIARLRPGVDLPGAQAELNQIARNISRADPRRAAGLQFQARPALQEVVGNVRPILLLLYGAVFCVLAVACANAATLLLVSAAARRREFAVRAALGAKPARLVRQLLVESLVIAICGGTAGITAAGVLAHLFVKIAPPETPRLAGFHLSWTALVYSLAISTATGLLFGAVPALALRRRDLASSLKQGMRTLERGSSRLRPGTLLIALQIAVSMMLACSAAVLTGSLLKILHTPRGFDSHGVLTAALSLPVESYPPRSTAVLRTYDRLLGELRRLPQVESVSLAQSLPMSGQNNSTMVEVAGSSQKEAATDLRFVEPAYFRTLRIPLLAGRYLSEADTRDRPNVVLVNQAFASRFLSGRDPQAVSITLGWGGDAPKQIVGVVGNIRHGAFSESAAPEAYVPVAQFPLNDMAVLLRARGNPYAAAAALRERVRQIDPAIPVEDVRTLDDYLRLSASPRSFLVWVLAAFAASALLLAAIGLYGVLSYSIACRRHEFGVRMALGSGRWSVMRLVLREGLAIAAAGVLAGLGLTLAASRGLARWLYDTSPTDSASLACAAAVLLAAAVAACWAPARRASRVDPIASLRGD